jgi:hypothetical protein
MNIDPDDFVARALARILNFHRNAIRLADLDFAPLEAQVRRRECGRAQAEPSGYSGALVSSQYARRNP